MGTGLLLRTVRGPGWHQTGGQFRSGCGSAHGGSTVSPRPSEPGLRLRPRAALVSNKLPWPTETMAKIAWASSRFDPFALCRLPVFAAFEARGNFAGLIGTRFAICCRLSTDRVWLLKKRACAGAKRRAPTGKRRPTKQPLRSIVLKRKASPSPLSKQLMALSSCPVSTRAFHGARPAPRQRGKGSNVRENRQRHKAIKRSVGAQVDFS